MPTGTFPSLILCDCYEMTKLQQFVNDRATDRWFFPGTSVSFTNKTDCDGITEMLLIESGVKHHKPNPNQQFDFTSIDSFYFNFCKYKKLT